MNDPKRDAMTIFTRRAALMMGGVGIGVAPRAAIWAHENVLTRVSTTTGSGKEPLIPAQGWPIETYFTATQELVFNGEPIQMIHMPNAHTDGDSYGQPTQAALQRQLNGQQLRASIALLGGCAPTGLRCGSTTAPRPNRSAPARL